MHISRRTFLKLSGTAAVLLGAGFPGLDLSNAYAYSAKLGKLKGTRETTSICPYCGVGCGLLVSYLKNGQSQRIVNVEGDPDHPINQGSLCSKGGAVYQINADPGGKRLRQVEYRAPGALAWKEVTWDWAMERIARRVKDTRDEHFKAINAKGQTINRNEAIACLGGASLDNEECYLLSKAMRSMGLVYLEHQARI